MAEFSLIERFFHKINESIIEPMFAPIRRKKLNNTDFTIISNNCWGGKVYEYFGLRKNSPTVGAYFYPSDFVAFVKNLKHYVSMPIEMISANQSKWYEKLKAKGQLNVPVGKLDDIEIIFLHYPDPAEAKNKWERRCKRINFNNIIYKFSYMNGCTENDIKNFAIATQGQKRVIFTSKKIEGVSDCIIIPYVDGALDAENADQITNDTFYFNKHIDVVELVNKDK